MMCSLVFGLKWFLKLKTLNLLCIYWKLKLLRYWDLILCFTCTYSLVYLWNVLVSSIVLSICSYMNVYWFTISRLVAICTVHGHNYTIILRELINSEPRKECPKYFQSYIIAKCLIKCICTCIIDHVYTNMNYLIW